MILKLINQTVITLSLFIGMNKYLCIYNKVGMVIVGIFVGMVIRLRIFGIKLSICCYNLIVTSFPICFTYLFFT